MRQQLLELSRQFNAVWVYKPNTRKNFMKIAKHV